jgi:hypothetical protein
MAQGLRAFNPALTADEMAGGMMEPATKPDVARLVRGLRTVRDAMGGPVAGRMADAAKAQRER